MEMGLNMTKKVRPEIYFRKNATWKAVKVYAAERGLKLPKALAELVEKGLDNNKKPPDLEDRG